MSPPSLLSPQKGIVTTVTTAIPLQQSASNTFSVSSSLSSLTKVTGEKEKDRHLSPAPLGTADSNVSLAHNPSATLSPAKAVKRGAAPGGGEKRKKALKRL
jgi:ubiquitin-conjugating enzyme E2 S